MSNVDSRSVSKPGVLDRIRIRLDAEGFSGLYVPGECACERSSLAPCGDLHLDRDGWINGCIPGHKIADPSGKSEAWLVASNATAMDQVEFDSALANWG